MLASCEFKARKRIHEIFVLRVLCTNMCSIILWLNFVVLVSQVRTNL